MRTTEIKNEIDEIRKRDEKIKRKDLKHETYILYIYGFEQLERQDLLVIILIIFILVKLI